MQDSTNIKGKIKIIGIGVMNSPFEVETYRKKYNVQFPLFSDQSNDVSEKLGANATPTFIGIKLNGDGHHKQIYFVEGDFHDTQHFLAEIIKSAGLK
jgi:peroxiredoxin